jgi:3-oxoacyl-[acyl-carrier protein] reductase
MPETHATPAAFVTGGGSGLGAAISRQLATDGFTIWVNDIDADGASSVASEVGGTSVPFDVSDAGAFDAAVEQMMSETGRIDVLVNNAGIVLGRPDVTQRVIDAQVATIEGREPEPIRATSTLSDDEWDRMIKIHLYGTFHGTRAALRHMEPARSGAIVNLASIYGFRGGAMNAEYAAAKHAVVGFTKSVGIEVARHGIRVNAVAPGFIDTPLLDPLGDFKPLILGNVASDRFGTAEEVAQLVAYLASDRASYHFGDILPITGGFSI